jgi:hypothetical protein
MEADAGNWKPALYWNVIEVGLFLFCLSQMTQPGAGDGSHGGTGQFEPALSILASSSAPGTPFIGQQPKVLVQHGQLEPCMSICLICDEPQHPKVLDAHGQFVPAPSDIGMSESGQQPYNESSQVTIGRVQICGTSQTFGQLDPMKSIFGELVPTQQPNWPQSLQLSQSGVRHGMSGSSGQQPYWLPHWMYAGQLLLPTTVSGP